MDAYPKGFGTFHLPAPSAEVRAEARAQAERLAEGLFAHQVEGVAFLLGRRRAILADDMGLGKTRQSVVALTHAAPKGPWLVVSPASVKGNWAREIAAVRAADRVHVIGPATPPPHDYDGWVVINYDLLGKHVGSLARLPWSGLVFDEAHYLKNHTSKRSKHARELVAAAPDAVLHALTGTPLTNRPRDLFPLLQLVGHPMGRSFLSFAKRYCAAYHNGYGWVTDGASNLDELRVQLHGVMLRRTKDEVLDLPPKLRTWVPVQVPEGTGRRETRRVLEKLLAWALERRRGEGQRAADEMAGAPGSTDARNATKPTAGSAAANATEPTAGSAAANAAEPTAAHAGGSGGSPPTPPTETRPRDTRESRVQLLGALTRARTAIASAKVKTTIEFVEGVLAQGSKVIVFSSFEDPVVRIAEHFGGQAVLLTGSTPSAQRQQLVDRFQDDPGARVFVANLVAGGQGINLTAATQVVFNDLDWVPANHWQAEDRAYRIGQAATVNVTYFCAEETIDEFVASVLRAKAALIEAVVEGRGALPVDADLLAELEALVRSLSPRLESVGDRDAGEDPVDRLLREAVQAARAREDTVVSAQRKTLRTLPADAILALARVLSGPVLTRYRARSASKAGAFYVLDVDRGDVTCSCAGFEYRGSCSHARALKEALAEGKRPPPGMELMARE